MKGGCATCPPATPLKSKAMKMKMKKKKKKEMKNSKGGRDSHPSLSAFSFGTVTFQKNQILSLKSR